MENFKIRTTENLQSQRLQAVTQWASKNNSFCWTVADLQPVFDRLSMRTARFIHFLLLFTCGMKSQELIIKHDCQCHIGMTDQKRWQQHKNRWSRCPVNQHMTKAKLGLTPSTFIFLLFCVKYLLCVFITALCVAASCLSALVSFLEAHCHMVLLLLWLLEHPTISIGAWF